MSNSDQHCPGFESNKKLSEIKLKCPECGNEFEVFSDEMDKKAKCVSCGAAIEPKECQV